MRVSELIEFLKDCDPNAHVVPAAGRGLSHFLPAIRSARESRAIARTRGIETKFLETPETGEAKVVILELR